MTNKNTLGPKGSKHDAEAAKRIGPQSGLKNQEGPGKQHPNPGDQGRHGGGEGETGMQPGAGHPRGR